MPTCRRNGADRRPILGGERSLGSVIKLLTPSDDYTAEYNAWLGSFPDHVYPTRLIIKRFYRADWGDDGARHFSVDSDQRPTGPRAEGSTATSSSAPTCGSASRRRSWRTFKLRQDFHPAAKVQTEDDITASVVVPADRARRRAPTAFSPQVRRQLRVPPLPAARRRDPPRPRPADGSRTWRARTTSSPTSSR